MSSIAPVSIELSGSPIAKNDSAAEDLLEYIIPTESHYLICNYFSVAPKHQFEWVDLTLKGRNIRIYGITEEERDKELMDAIGGLIEPVVINKDLFAVIERYLLEHPKLTHLAEKQKYIPACLCGEYTTLEYFHFVLGEEFSKRIWPLLKLYWCLKKESVPRFKQMIEYFKTLGREQQIYAEKVMDQFAEERDYLFEDAFLPQVLHVTHRLRQPWPRVERVKESLRNYFLYASVASKMYKHLEDFFTAISLEDRERLAISLEEAESDDEKAKILAESSIPKLPLSEEEKPIFCELLSVLISPENEFLLRPIEAIDSSMAEENPSDTVELGRIYLQRIESNAKSTLEKVCLMASVRILFKQDGREISLGAQKKDFQEIEEYLKQEEEDEAVLV